MNCTGAGNIVDAVRQRHCCRRRALSVDLLLQRAGVRMSQSFQALPREVVDATLSFFRRGDLRTLASCAAAAQSLRPHCAPMLNQVLACRHCSAPLFHPRELRSGEAPGRIFKDGPVLSVAVWPPLQSESKLCTRDLSAIEARWNPRLLHQLGAAVRWLHDVEGLPPREDWLIQHLFCGGCHLYLGERAAPRPGSLPSGSVAETGGAFVCAAYVRRLDGLGPCEVPKPLRCSGARGGAVCGQVLSDMNDVLSWHHSWSPPGGPVEDAWYVNSMVEGSAHVGPPRRRRLAQGPMEVADVFCSVCDGVVGWRFARDLDPAQTNRNQLGRFGICRSSILESRRHVTGNGIDGRLGHVANLPEARAIVGQAANQVWESTFETTSSSDTETETASSDMQELQVTLPQPSRL